MARHLDRQITRLPAAEPRSRRVRKARKNGTLTGCGHFALAGHTIILIDGLWWCAPCILSQIRAATANVAPAS